MLDKLSMFVESIFQTSEFLWPAQAGEILFLMCGSEQCNFRATRRAPYRDGRGERGYL